MGFDPDTYLAEKSASGGPGGFDPDAYLAAKVPSDPKAAGQAALEHFGNAASLGYLPQLQATAAQLTPDPNADVDAKLRAQGFKINQPQTTYVQDRDANIKRMEQEGKDYPLASAAGSVGGALASAGALSAATPINAATRMGRVLQAAKGGAILGALSNPGDTEGQVADGIQAGDRLKGAAFGGALGAAGQGVMEGVGAASRGVQSLPGVLQGKAEERAFKAAGGMLKDYRNAVKPGQPSAEDVGRYMLDNGLVKPGMSVQEIHNAADVLKSQSGNGISETLNRLDEAGAAAPSHESIAAEIEKQAGPLKNLNTAKPTHDALMNLAEDIRTLGKEPPVGVSKGEVGSLTGRGTEYLTDPETGEVMAQFRNGKMVTASGSSPASAESASAATVATPKNIAPGATGTFQGAQDIRSFINKQIENSGGWKAPNPSEKNLALKDAWHTVNNAIEDSAGKAADAAGDPDILKKLLTQKSDYQKAKVISEIAQDKALKLKSNAPISLQDSILGGSGAMIGAMTGDSAEDRIKRGIEGAGIALASKAARHYGTPYLSTGLNWAGKTLARTPMQSIGEAIAPALGAAVRSPAAPAAAESLLTQPRLEQAALRSVASQPPKGEDKWAQDGLSNLGIKDPAQAQQLLGSPKARQLLIQASDLKPGSKAMRNVYNQLQSLKGAP